MTTPLSTTPEWDFPLLETYDREIARLAKSFGLETYPNQIEVISTEQMMDAYSSAGMPVGYHHWSFGKKFLDTEKKYKRGQMGLAYEIVINSNPCIAYLMEENSITMQATVLAHACYGHNSFFKNNYLFKQWTHPDSIIDYLIFARNYLRECEQRYGIDQVEELLDACHVLMNYGVDRYKHPNKLSLQDEKTRQHNREQYLQDQVNDLWRTIPKSSKKQEQKSPTQFPAEPQENLLYFIEKNAPLLEPWQREIVRIVRKIAQYFYPQRQTQVMNEGWACFWHYTILNQLYDEGLVTDQFMLEFIENHTNVIYQPPFHSRFYTGLNPYTLGYNMYQDIKRICENPTNEDREWFPDIAGKDWLETLHFAMNNFKDESFISQYLSPRLIREFKLFSICDDDQQPDLVITAIHDEHGYQHIRESLSKQFDLGNTEPNIQVQHVDLAGDRTLTLRHFQDNRRPLGEMTAKVLKHCHHLWQCPVKIESIDPQGKVAKVYEFPS